MNPTIVVEILSGLRLMKFFPNDEHAMVALTRMVGSMCDSEFQVDWLVKRMLNLYNEWPGAKEMRACFCSRFPPKDGINAYSQVFVEGIPSESESRNLQISGPELLQLPAGKVSKDEGCQFVVDVAVRVNSMVSATFQQPATPAEIAAAPKWLRKLEGYE